MAEKKETTKRKYERKTTVKKIEETDFDFSKVKTIKTKDLLKKPDSIPEAKPEKLESVTTNKGIPKAEAKPEKLGVITISDLPRPRKIKVAKSHKPGENIIITTGDFKPRKFKDMAKL